MKSCQKRVTAARTSSPRSSGLNLSERRIASIESIIIDHKMQNRAGKIRVVWTVIQLAIISLVVGAALNYQLILDRYALLTYHPTADVAAIEARLGLTDHARAILYRANPKIDDKSAFNADC